MTTDLPVLDRGYVRFIEHWGSDERVIEAARMSTNKGFQGWDADAKLLAYLYNNHHATPFEMAGMVIEVKAPIFVFREWHRHRTQSYNEMSARYVPLPDENYCPSLQRIKAGVATAAANRQAQGAASRAGGPLFAHASVREPSQLARLPHAAHGAERPIGNSAIRERCRRTRRGELSPRLGAIQSVNTLQMRTMEKP